MNKIFKLRQMRWVLAGIVLLAALVTGILIARPIEDKTDKIQPDWSRGVRVGSSPWNQRAAIHPSDDGKRVHLAWPDNRPGGSGVSYLQLNERARRVAEEWLGGVRGTPQSVRLILDEEEHPHIFAIARMPGSDTAQLVHWSLEADGTQRTSVQPFSPADVDVESYAVVSRQSGLFEVFWAAKPGGDTQGLYYVGLNVDGQAMAGRRLNERPVLEVSAQADHNGNVHLSWAEALSARTWQVSYAAFPADAPQPTEGMVVVESADAIPVLGLDGETIYILWGREIKGGLLAGMGFTTYVSFPLGRPEAAQQGPLFIPGDGLREEYMSYQGEYSLDALVSANAWGQRDFTNFLHSPAPIGGQRDEMALATIAGLSFGLNEGIVPTLVVMRDGKPTGYQVMAYNRGFNARPVVAADEAGNLYATWLTGSTGAGFRVYYATTTASSRAVLDPRDLTDYLVTVAVASWRMLGGLALLMFFPLVVLPAFVVVVGYAMYGGGSELLSDRQSYVILIVSCLAYWLTKEVLLGSVLADPVIGRELVGWSRAALVWAIQLAIAAVPAWITWRQIKAGRIDSIFWAMLTFIACDAVLTMLAAGPTLALRG